MRVYLAGMYDNGFLQGTPVYESLNEVEKLARNWGAKHQLESYWFVNKQIKVDRMRRDGAKVFMDSGAFSAFNKGISVNLVEYVDYLKRNADIIEIYSVLDAIGNAQKTLENQTAMESLGVRPIPCFHYGEDERYLEHYLTNYDYIALGGMAIASSAAVKIWFDRLWSKFLTDGSGRARVKVHGFAITSPDLMMRYPWYSVDSSTWVQRSMYGELMIPEMRRNVVISERASQRQMIDRHYDTFDSITRAQIDKYIIDAGFDPQRLRTMHGPRWAFNCYAFRRLGEMATKTEEFVFKLPEQELF